MKLIEALLDLESFDTFLLAFLLTLVAHLADIVSSLSCTLIGGCYEANTLARTSLNYFDWVPGVEMKMAYLLFWLLPICYFIYRFTRSYLLASLPLFWEAYTMWYIVVGNICVLLSSTR